MPSGALAKQTPRRYITVAGDKITALIVRIP
jgi:hypothetical protein